MRLNATHGALAAIGFFYVVLALYQLWQQMWLDAVIWIVLGAGMALSLTATPEAWRARPRWLRWLAVGLTLIGLGLFIIQIVIDFQR
jgi:uncharacterized membrane protein YczE